MFRSFSFRTAGVAKPAEPGTRAPRIAVIDIGSNSVRLVVYVSVTRSPTVFFNEKTLCGLGDALETTGRLSPAGRERAMDALARYAELARSMDVSEVGAVGTAALRDAADGPDFIEAAKREIGLEIAVASGADEARLAAQGVILGDPFAEGVVADMGGASMELVQLTRREGAPPEIASGVTTRLGPLRMRAMGQALGVGEDLSQTPAKARKALEQAVDAELSEALASTPLPTGQKLFLLGGSFRALARGWMAKTDYPLQVLHEYALPFEEARDMAAWGAVQNPGELRDLTGVSESRARVTPFAALALGRLVKLLEPSRVSISAFGLREGVLWERMPDALRQQDPLIDACRDIEATNARSPGFGAELWRWLAPLDVWSPQIEPRLAEAACLLSDSVWRAHPDYRGQASFELVTRNNFGGVDHRGRMAIAAALLFRFKGARKSIKELPAASLLEPAALEAAEALGRGMRLGAVLTGATAGLLAETRLEVDEGTLRLTLGRRVAPLAGEEVERRLAALAESLKLPEAVLAVER